jgi:hypothetical protein
MVKIEAVTDESKKGKCPVHKEESVHQISAILRDQSDEQQPSKQKRG